MTTTAAMASLLAGALMSTASPPPAQARPAPTGQTQVTNLWAGWSAHPSAVVRTVTAAWTVPEVTCGLIQPLTDDDTRAAPWIGIWGVNSDDDGMTQLAQLGTESHCVNDWGLPRYWAVGQMYPISQRVNLFEVSAGDYVSVELSYQGRQPDRKLRYTGSIVVTSAGGGSPRSWYGEFLTEPDVNEMDAAGQGGCIVESQPLDDDLTALARFDSPIRFSPCRVNGQGIGSFPESDLTRWDMKADGRDMATTGSADQGGEFAVGFVSKRGDEI